MKIIILTNNYPRKNALNSGVFIHQQVRALQQLGAECHVLLLYNWYPPVGLHSLHGYWRQGYELHKTFFSEYEGIPIHHIPMVIKMPNRLFKETYHDRAEQAILRYVRRHRELQDANWLYAHFLTDVAYIGARVKDKLGVKLAAIARGDDVHAWPEEKPELRKQFPLVFGKADLLLANSGNLAKDAQKWMEPGKVREVKVVYNGVD